MYLPEKWGLVAFGITTAILDIVQGGFVGSQIVVLDGSTTRTTFLQSALIERYGGDIRLPQACCIDNMWTEMGPTTTRTTKRGMGSIGGIDEGAEEHSKHESSATDRSVDTVRHAEVSLGSRDTLDMERTQEDTVDTGRSAPQGDSISALSPRREAISALSTPVHDVGGSTPPTVYTTEGWDTTIASQSAGGVLKMAMDVEGTLEEGGTIGDEELSLSVEEVAEILATSLHSGDTFIALAEVTTSPHHPSVIIPVPNSSVVGGPKVLPTPRPDAYGLAVLPSSGAAVGSESTALMFRWAMPDRDMRLASDGFYYDHDEDRYKHIGVPGQYTYEQAASIMEEGGRMDHVPSPLANAIVAQALEYADPDTPAHVRAALIERRVASEEGLDEGTQSLERIAETPE
jgi:hypothetical protein